MPQTPPPYPELSPLHLARLEAAMALHRAEKAEKEVQRLEALLAALLGHHRPKPKPIPDVTTITSERKRPYL